MATHTASPDAVISHWYTLIENLQASPLQVYQSVEGALQRRQVPEIRTSRVDYKEAGVGSARREYLHVTREKLVFDICAAPFGNAFFVSWWLAEAQLALHPLLQALAVLLMLGVLTWVISTFGGLGFVLLVAAVLAILYVVNNMATEGTLPDDFVTRLPLIGAVYERLFKPATYYRIDTTLMFQEAVRHAVLEVIDEITTAKGLRALTESERKPILREFYKRKMASWTA